MCVIRQQRGWNCQPCGNNVRPLPPYDVAVHHRPPHRSGLTDPSHDVAFSSEWTTMADLKGKLTPAEFLAALKGRKPPAKHIAPPAIGKHRQLDLSDLAGRSGPMLGGGVAGITQADDAANEDSGDGSRIRAESLHRPLRQAQFAAHRAVRPRQYASWQ